MPAAPRITPYSPPVTVSVCCPEFHNSFPVESTIENTKGRVPVTGAFDSSKRPSYARTGLGAGSATWAVALPARHRTKIDVRVRSLIRKLSSSQACRHGLQAQRKKAYRIDAAVSFKSKLMVPLRGSSWNSTFAQKPTCTNGQVDPRSASSAKRAWWGKAERCTQLASGDVSNIS